MHNYKCSTCNTEGFVSGDFGPVGATTCPQCGDPIAVFAEGVTEAELMAVNDHLYYTCVRPAEIEAAMKEYGIVGTVEQMERAITRYLELTAGIQE